MYVGAARANRAWRDDLGLPVEDRIAPAAAVAERMLPQLLRQGHATAQQAHVVDLVSRRRKTGGDRSAPVRVHAPAGRTGGRRTAPQQGIAAFAAVLVAGATIFAAWIGMSNIVAGSNAPEEGRLALGRAIASWRVKGAERLELSMRARQRLLVDIDEETAAHLASAANEPAAAQDRDEGLAPPLLEDVSLPAAAKSPPALAGSAVSFITHHRRIQVSDTGLARIDLSTLLADTEATGSVVVEGVPTGLIPVIGTLLDGSRWRVDRTDLADFALVLGVGPAERFELRLGRLEGDGSFRLDALVSVELQRPATAPAPTASGPGDAAKGAVETAGASVPRRTARAKAAADEADEKPPPAPSSRKAASAAKSPVAAAMGQRPSALGVGVRAARTAKPAPSDSGPAAEAPWWAKAKHFTVEDIR